MKMSYKTLGWVVVSLIMTIASTVASVAMNGSMLDDMTKIRDGEKLDVEMED